MTISCQLPEIDATQEIDYSRISASMTSYAGYTISAAECCGVRYAIRRYRSINFSASCYWTDGYRENSLMPNDHGLRQCKCGVFFVQKDLVEIDQVQESELPSPARVEPSILAIAIQQASNEKIEAAARLDYWHHLNHHYRNLYRIHRDAEEQEAREKWETAHPDTRSLWQIIRKAKRTPEYTTSFDRPITFPAFTPSWEQEENMRRLLQLLLTSSNRTWYAYEIVELNRELGRFAEASKALEQTNRDDESVLHGLLAKLIKEQQAAPVRYRV
ncbi:MAG: hypothetical protein ACKO0Z_02495 [Betaproteobacteria bacterium]